MQTSNQHTQNNNFVQTQLNPLPLCLLETWSPCSRPFAILPVSAVSDAQKLATGNFLHVRAATFSYFLLSTKSRAKNFGTFLSESLPHSVQHAPRAFSAALGGIFRRLRRFFPTFCIVQKVEQKNYSALRRYPCRDGTLRVLFEYFLHTAKSTYRKIPQIR